MERHQDSSPALASESAISLERAGSFTDRSRFASFVLDRLPGRKIVNWSLRTLLPERRLATSAIRYRIRDLTSLYIANEVFRQEAYAKAFERRRITTFVDLGCHVGYFSCYAAHRAENRNLIGLAVDAHPQAVQETLWHMRRNGLTQVKVLQGLVGSASAADAASTPFYLSASPAESSQFPQRDPQMAKVSVWSPISVSPLNVAEAWHWHAEEKAKERDSERIDLLKIDIEGSEGALFSQEPALLALADAVVLEWHRWLVPEVAISGPLEAAGFRKKTVLSRRDCPAVEVALFEREP